MNFKIKKKLIVFDLDGTLIDSKHLVIKILNSLREEKGLNKLNPDKILSTLSLGGISMIKKTLETSENETEKFLQKFRTIYSKTKTPISLIYNNVPETLTYLKNKQYLIAICSNKPINLISNTLRDTNLDHFFNFIVGEDQKSLPKPNPERILKCIKFFNLKKSDVVFIGDSKVDQLAAQNSKVDFIFFEKGYDDGVDKSKLPYSISDFKEIKNIF